MFLQSVRLHARLEAAFYRLGLFIGRHAKWLLLGSLLVASILLTGLVNLKMKDKVRHGYTPDDAPSHYEHSIYARFYNQTGMPIGLGIFIESADGGNLLRHDQLLALTDFVTFLTENFTIEHDGIEFGYDDFCQPRCTMNAAVLQFSKMLRQSVFGGFTNSTPFQLDYPVANIGGIVELPIYTTLFGVTVAGESDDSSAQVETGTGNYSRLLSSITNMRHLQVAVLWFLSGTDYKEQAELWENKLFDLVQAKSFNPLIDLHVYGDESVNREVLRGGMNSGAYIIGGTALMFSFILVTVVAASALNGQMSWQKLVLVCVSVCSPLLAVSMSFSIIVWSGAQITAFMCMTPVLILGIGVDDAFLLMHSWLRFGNDPAFGRLPIQIRVALVLRDVGPSISITSLTNGLAFCVGILTPVYQIRMFCVVTAMSVALDFILQLSFFTSITALLHQRRSSDDQMPMNERLPKMLPATIETEKLPKLPEETDLLPRLDEKVPPPKAESPDLNANSPSVDNKNFDLAFEIANQQKADEQCSENMLEPSVDFELPFITKWLHVYCGMLCTTVCRLYALCTLVAFWTIAVLGVAKMEPSFTLSKTLPEGSPLTYASEVVQEKVWRENYGVLVFINRPPNITNASQLDDFMKMMERFERLPNHLGREGNMFWLRDYVKYHEASTSFFDFLGAEPLDYGLVPDFLDLPQYGKYKSFVKWHRDERDTVRVDTFVTMMFFANMSEWATRAHSYMSWRAVAAEYPQFNVSMWEYDSPIFDLIMLVPDITIRSIVITLLCMSAVCVLIVPNVTCVLAAVGTVISITLVMTGMLSFWGADLDPIVMLNIIMSVGFNVDYTAHVTYHFYKSGVTHTSMVDRLAVTIAAVAFPMLQAGGSTLLCVCLMVLNHVYAYTLFVKSITLVVIFGVFHGIFVLPCLLASFPGHWTAAPATGDKPKKTITTETVAMA